MDKKERKNLLVFGYGLSLIIMVFIIHRWSKHGTIGIMSYVFLALAISLVILTASDVSRIKPFYTIWMKVAKCIGTVIFGSMLTVLFFLLFTPMGVIMRLTGRDPMERKIDPGCQTFWIKRDQKEFDQKNYRYQF